MFRRLFGLFGYVPAATAVDRAAAFKADVAKVSEFLSDDAYEWRSLKAVRNALGIAKSGCPYVRAVLKAAEARPSYRNQNRWGLKSVVGESGRRSRRY